jgi:hypothetical protein
MITSLGALQELEIGLLERHLAGNVQDWITHRQPAQMVMPLARSNYASNDTPVIAEG